MAEKSLPLCEYLDNYKVLPYDKTPSLLIEEIDIKSFLSASRFNKYKSLKLLTNALINAGFVGQFSLNIDKSLKPKAYMKDCGQAFLSIGLIFTRSYYSLLSTYLHELAHIWMSQQANYFQLKELQKEFCIRFSASEFCEILSPIEVYADAITLKFLDEIFTAVNSSKGKNKILKLINVRKEKLRFVYNEIEKLLNV